MNKTKIIATIGPATDTKEKLKNIIMNGVDVIRINMSHANHSYCKRMIDYVKEINEELKLYVPIMLDLAGPEIRILKLKDKQIELKEGQMIKIYADGRLGSEDELSVNKEELITNVKYNSIIKLDDGKISLQVINKMETYIECKVLIGGILKSGKAINVPDCNLNLPFLSEKDKSDILFASKNNVDFLALSFVRNEEDILEVTDLLIEKKNDHMSIISKIECESAIDEIDEIIRLSDGVMVARGDLGVEIPIERVPGITKLVISKCHTAGKVSIIATDLMSSMENSLEPTRAEVSDVANAVIDGVDAIVLTGETTVGMYPNETVMMMEKIIESTEEDINYYELLDKAMRTEKQDITGSIAYSVVECADRLKAKAIVIPTMSGYTAKKISRFRPACPIIALSPNEDVLKELSLYFGVYTYKVKEIKNFDKMMELAKKMMLTKISLNPFDKYIITGGYPFNNVKHTNFMKIEEL